MLRRDGMLWREPLRETGVVGFIVMDDERVLPECRLLLKKELG